MLWISANLFMEKLKVSSTPLPLRNISKSHGIEYIEKVEDGHYVGSFYVFKFPAMTEEQLEKATEYTEVKFYQ